MSLATSESETGFTVSKKEGLDGPSALIDHPQTRRLVRLFGSIFLDESPLIIRLLLTNIRQRAAAW